MTNEDFTQNSEPPREDGIPTDARPLGYWLRTVDALITREFATALAAEDVSRRDWMLLNALSGAVDVPGLADKLARRGKRLRSLAERGWVVENDGRWELTDEGRAAQQRLGDLVQGVREKVAGAVSPEDFATMTASLEAIARELGWDENARMPHRGRRGFGPRHRGFGPGFPHAPFGEGFGPGDFRGYGPGFRRGFGPGFAGGFASGDPRWAAFAEHAAGHDCADGHRGHRHHDHPQHDHGHRGHGRGRGEGRSGERAYERGFEAGFRSASRADGAAEAASGSAA
jgi:hypothetical protein